MTEEQEVFLKHIQKKGLKRTTQRDLILDVFLRTEAHLSNEDLYQLVKQEDPSVGQTTVYRTLKLLTEAGLAREVRFGDNRTHYEHNYKHQHHDHMICSECGKIIEFFSAGTQPIRESAILAEMSAALKFFSDSFGAYPYAELRAAFHPFAFGQAFPSLLLLPNTNPDGKAAYLDEMPRVLRYLRRACDRYDALHPLRRLLDEIHGGVS